MSKKKPDTTTLVRTPEVLGPLIKQDLHDAEKAGLEFYLAIGAKLNEARESIKGDRAWGRYRQEWCPEWSPEQCERYQRAARRYTNVPPPEGMTITEAGDYGKDSHRKRLDALKAIDAEDEAEYQREQAEYEENRRKFEEENNKPITDEERAKMDAEREADDREHEANKARFKAKQDRRNLWVRKIIITGFRTLSKEFHPDTGGNTHDFVELGEAKDYALTELQLDQKFGSDSEE